MSDGDPPPRTTEPWHPRLDPVLLEKTAPGSQEPSREGQVFEGESLVVRLVNLVKLPHTVFALPFALLGVVYGSFFAPVTVRTVVLRSISVPGS